MIHKDAKSSTSRQNNHTDGIHNQIYIGSNKYVMSFSYDHLSVQFLSFCLTRLYLLVKLFGGVEVAEFSSRLSPSERQKTLKDFEQGKIPLYVFLNNVQK